MKLRLPSLLSAALLACMACSVVAYADTYLPEGVNETGFQYDTSQQRTIVSLSSDSDRFYDGGKGSDWGLFSSNAYSIYKANDKDLSIFGDLSSSISVGGYYLSFNNLTDDSGHCWAYTSSNMLQHWQTYYGVFATKARETNSNAPVHGFNYDAEYMEQLGGTQSLKLNKLYYDNWKNIGAYPRQSFSWYLAGEGGWSQQESGSTAGGYFKQFFPDYNTSYVTVNIWTTAGLPSISDFSNNIKEHFGYTKNSDGVWEQTTKGQIMYLELTKGTYPNNASHAITCYGFDTNDNGDITALYVVNSDDSKHQLVKVYVKMGTQGLELYAKEDYSVTYNDWNVTGWSYINTPQVLKDMLAEYEKGKMTWMGREGITWKNSSDTADVNVLPTDETGWMTYAGTGTEHAGYYNTYYAADRGVVFNDAASSGTVNVAEDITISSMEVNNSSLDYTFDGGESAKTITVDEFTKKGSAAVTFNGVDVVAGTATLEGDVTFDNLHVTGTLNAAGRTIHADSITLDGDATIGTIGGTNGENATGTTDLTITAGTTTIQNSSTWTNLKSLTLSDTTKLNVGASLNVAGNISCGAESLPESGSAEIKTTYCLKVGGNMDLAGSISSGAYIKVAGDAHVTGNVTTTKDYIEIGGTANIGGNLNAGEGSITLNTGGTIGGQMKGSTITLKGDTSANNIADGAAVVVQGGTTSTREVAWTNLKSLEISETARYTSGASVNVAGNISTASTAVGSLPAGTEAGIEATYCIKVGGDVTLAGSMKSGAYVDITGGADITGDLTSTGSTHEHYISIGKDLNLGGNLTAKKQVTIGGNATIGGTTNLSEGLAVTGDLNLKGDGTVAGKVSANNLTLAAGKVLTATGGLTVAGTLTGEVPAQSDGARARAESTGTITLKSSASNVDVKANSITVASDDGSTVTLDSVGMELLGGKLTMENAVVTGSCSFTAPEALRISLEAKNVTIVLDGSNSIWQGAPFQAFSLMPLDATAQAEVSSGTFYIDSTMLDNVDVSGDVKLDLSHYADEIQKGGYDNVVLAFADDMTYAENATVQATLDGTHYVPATYTGDNMAQFGMVTASIPEPATATLSLLALAALAARRRRR